MAKCARDMALENRGVQLLGFASAYRLEEVAEMVAAPFEAHDEFSLEIEHRCVRVARADHITLGTVEKHRSHRSARNVGSLGILHHAGLCPTQERRGLKPANLEYERFA